MLGYIGSFRSSRSCRPHYQTSSSLALGKPEMINFDGRAMLIQKPLLIRGRSLCTASFLEANETEMDLNQEKLVTFNELEPSVLAAKYGFIAVASEDGEIRIYCETKLPRKTPLYSEQFDTMINSCDISCRVFFDKKERREYTFLFATNDGEVITVMVYQEKDAKGQCVHTMTQTEDVGFFVDVNQPVNDVRLSPNKRWILLVGDEHYATAALVDYRIGPESNPNVTALENEEVIVMDDSEDSDSDPNEEWSDITEEETYEPCDMYLATRWDIDYWFELREQIQVFESDVHGVLANMQYVTWNCDSSLAAISCDTHPCIFIVGFPTEQDLKRNPKASPKALKTVRVSEPTCAISFHPVNPNVLVVALTDTQSVHMITLTGYSWTSESLKETIQPIYSDPFVNALPEISGLQWSDDGRFLYLANVERVLLFRYRDGQFSLQKLAQDKLLEYNLVYHCRYPDTEIPSDSIVKEIMQQKSWFPHYQFEG